MADPVWLMVMFDLPVTTKQERKGANDYRNTLLDEGFDMLQFSVYVKHVFNAASSGRTLKIVKGAIPVSGAVRVFRLTDEQWARAWRFENKKILVPEAIPEQLILFD
ncbi:MAG: CRISPR-associated endonuclease Cas2 [Micrococcaceae bacterium]